MPSGYLPIESSDIVQTKDENKVRPEKSGFHLKSFTFLLILIIVTFIIAAVFRQYNQHAPTVAHDNPVLRKGWLRLDALPSTNETAIHPPIGGRLSCGRRGVVASASSPSDANQVRPADIKYIAAMGDSFMTGYLSYSTHSEADDVLRNVMGNSFAMGGNDELERHITVANILRRLNPALIGYSTGLGLNEEQTNLNVALPGMWVDDLQRQARELIRRLRNYSARSLRDDWKLVHIFSGTRDISGFCMGQGGTDKQEYKRNLTEAIEILQNALPKTIISIIGVANFDFLWNAEKITNQSYKADVGFKMAGPCQISETLSQRRIEEYREANIEIVAEMALKSPKDHAIIVQHIFDDLWEPLRGSDGSFNTEFYAADSFHLSNYGNSLVAKQLWNQLVSPDSRKISNNAMMTDDNEPLLCPEYRCPFIRTPSNSIACVMTEENVIDGVL